MEIAMTISYGKRSLGKRPSPSSTRAVAAEMAASPHADVLPPPDPAIKETARRAEISNEARALLYQGLCAHEILERYPEESHWMAEHVRDWEVVHRREQMDVVEGQDKPAPKFSAPAPAPASPKPKDGYLPLPPVDVDKPKFKSVGIKATVWRSDTGEGVEEMVWWPRKLIKDGKVSQWIVDKKRAELEEKYPVQSIDNFPKAA